MPIKIVHACKTKSRFLGGLAALLTFSAVLVSTPVGAQSGNPFARTNDEPTTSTLLLPLIKIDGAIEERSTPLALFGEKSGSLHELIELIDKAAEDDNVAALAVQVQRPMMGLAQTTELRNAFLRFRESDKDLIMLLDIADLKGYYLASAGNEVVLTPVGGLMTYGLSFNLYFFRDMLAKVGLKAQVVNTGDFKNALEPFTNQEMSEGTRIQYTKLMEDLLLHMGEAMGASRGLEGADVLGKLFTGPLLAEAAASEGLITRSAYFEDYLETYTKEHDLKLTEDYDPIKKKAPEVPNLFSLFSAPPSKASRINKKPKIALIYALGNIVDGDAQEDPFSESQMIASDTFIALLDEAVQENPKAIVIRVDSGGGSAVASDRIWHKLKTIREENGIPVVVSMGNVAASGGYYISMGADRIFVQPTTITGSIGVIAGRVVMGGLYEKIGVNRQAISQGEHSWLADETLPYSEEQVAFIETLISKTYDDFTIKAASSRGMTQDEIKAIASGRVWTGLAAIDNGLADELGGLQDAIAYARTLSEDGEELPVIEYPKEKSFSDILNEIMTGTVSAGNIPQSLATQKMLNEWKGLLPQNAVLHRFMGTLAVLSEDYQLLAVEPMMMELE